MTWGVLRNQPIVVLWPENHFIPPAFGSYVVYSPHDPGKDYWIRQGADRRLVAENVTR